MVQNLVKLSKSHTSTYAFGEPYVHRSDPRDTRILLKIVDVGCFTEKLLAKMKEEINQDLVKMGYSLVESIKDANLVITVVFKNFSQISDATVQSLTKYIQYKEAAGLIRASNDRLIANEANLTVVDDGVSFSSLQQGSVGGVGGKGFFTSLFQKDFTSGAALGALAAFLITSANPLVMFLGAATGAVITAVLQLITQTRNYSGSISLRISKRTKKHLIKKKVLTFESSNVTQEAFVEDEGEWMDYNSDLLVVVDSPISRRRAMRAFAKQSAKSLASLLAH